jgi:hypothetical protein
LGQQTWLVALEVARPGTYVAREPAVGAVLADGVFARTEEVRHVTGVVVELGIVRPARREAVLADAPPVDVELV